MFFVFSLYEIPSLSSSSFTEHFRRLLEEADETDSIHDVTLQAGNRTFPAHKYILSMRSAFFQKLFSVNHGAIDKEEPDKEISRSEDAVGCDLITFEKIAPELLEYALQFIYTDSCELLIHGARPQLPKVHNGQNQVQRNVAFVVCQMFFFKQTESIFVLSGCRTVQAYQRHTGLGLAWPLSF